MAITDYSPVASENATVLGVNIGEGTTAPSAVNNALRQIPADIAAGFNFSLLASFFASTTLSQARSALGVTEGSASQTAFAALTNTANSVPYMTGSDGWALTTLSSFVRTLLDDGDAATFLATLGLAVTGTASSGSFAIGTFKINWVDGTAAANTSTAINYHTAYSSWSRAICTGGSTDPNAEENNPFVSSTSTTAATVSSARDTSTSVTIIAIGV